MATTDNTRDVHRGLAEELIPLAVQYKCFPNPRNFSDEAFTETLMAMYEASLIQLSSVWEHVIAAVRTANDKPDSVVSIAHADLRSGGEAKTAASQRNGRTKDGNHKHRHVIRNTKGKTGTIYCAAWNHILKQIDYYAIPYSVHKGEKNFIPIQLKGKMYGDDYGSQGTGLYNEYYFDNLVECVIQD